ncbi:RsmE family RNA methyltransferase, partial [Microbacterium sp. K41]|uniref:RsmE family RNA methyltransferase n=1 Tax=Microbacterium sp. K41 TaxID=2305437 RepID=UPI00109D3E51
MALHFLVETAGGAAVGDVVTLTGAEAKHAAVVRRLRVGEAVTVGDGRGVWLTGVAEEVSPSRVEVRVQERAVSPSPSPRVVLVQALAKGDRDELAVQAACELGVDEIVPWQAGRSISRWEGPKAAKGRERWATIVREAAKQAHRAWVPEVAPVASTAQLA